MAFDYAESWLAVCQGFECPLSLEIMTDPVIVTDEDPVTKIRTMKNYEREAISLYFRDKERKQLPYIDPCSMHPCSNILIPNTELKNKIVIFNRANAEFERNAYISWQEGENINDIPSFKTIRAQVGNAGHLILYGNTWIYLDDDNKEVINLHNKTSEISPSLWLNFTDFLCDNQEILLGLLLGTTLLLGMGALTVGTCGMTTILPVAAATVLVTAIGIEGIIAFLSVGAVVTGISGLVGAGWIGYSIFSHCKKSAEEPQIERPAQEVI